MTTQSPSRNGHQSAAANPFKQATKQQSRLRMALVGTSGSGKTYTALTLGCRLAQAAGGRVALIDTESGSASLYADLFDFDALSLASFSPQTYIDAIHAAEAAGYPVIVIDSLSHAWSGKDGALELVDKAQKRAGGGGNSFTAWRDVTPVHNAMIDAIVGSSAHIIATMRAKTEYVMEKDQSSGKVVPRKVGMAPVQRDGMEYEFTVVGTMDVDSNTLVISKSRMSDLAGGVITKPTAALADQMVTWLDSGEAVSAPPRPQPDPEDEQPAPSPQRMTQKEFVRVIHDELGLNDALDVCGALGIVSDGDPKGALMTWLATPGHNFTKIYEGLQAEIAAQKAAEAAVVIEDVPADDAAPERDGLGMFMDEHGLGPDPKARTVASRGAH